MFEIAKDVLALLGAMMITSVVVGLTIGRLIALVTATHERPGYIDFQSSRR